MLPRRPEKLKALTEAVERHNSREALADVAVSVAEQVQENDDDLADDDWNMEEE
jgi:hypothetical protein